MKKKIVKWLTPIVIGVILILVWQFFFPVPAEIENWRDYGPTPELAEPRKRLLPTIRPSRASSWAAGEVPSVADGLQIAAFASGLSHPRWLYVLPNGDVLVAESDAPKSSKTCNFFTNFFAKMVMRFAGANTKSADRIVLLRDSDQDGSAETQFTFIDGLHSPLGMALIGANFFVANADSIVRFPYASGQTKITSQPELIAEIPAGRNHHWTKNILATPDGQSLFVTVGSNSNVGECGPSVEEQRAAILQVKIADGVLRNFASGIRNPNGMAFEPGTGELWTVVNERDEIGGDLVPDYVTSVREGDFFGWPQYYYGDNLQPDLDERWTRNERFVRAPDYAVGNHTASLDIAFTHGSELPARWQQGMVVTQHGSWNRWPRSGYRVIYVPFENGVPNGIPTVLIDDFLDQDGRARGRPVGVILDKQGALLVADDVGNVVWRVASRR